MAQAASPSSILANVVPPNPAPFEDVNIILNSYADNLDNVSITWFLNGKNVSSGIGKKSFSLKAPAAGSETMVVAVISLPDGDIETKVTIRPSLMVLLWQANDSYVPPFYRGKAMPSPDSKVKVVAIPEIKNSGGGLVDPKNMTYYWKKDYTNMSGDSGYGKNFFFYTNDYLETSNNISVTASTVDQRYGNQANINIGITEPKILFYKNDKNMGTIWDRALASPYRINGDETVVATPYFISPKELLNPRLVWNWFINDNIVSVLGFKKNFMPLKTQEGISGTSKLRLEIENRDKIFQKASTEINIEF
ncbi:hypothetical protein A3A05_00230 [Candidatus Nomurabacteria bacterium RIFCSPLOWO2_01_FULL_41_12]|uniref:Ig-like domain-containing protein n=1 Tax=Candidatus Nomurabacteria bacterium RIFCSPLOWO2_01_FULL_41_12 TaxID=1801774 RepID=A0A1F6WWU9_9BACT|nr:MAG: hypothetical protein A2732_00135 [Candidatus Nomurabacteria bacterium RIFCSPHIGHO2_01_FULL_40_10]OGI86361.1 MAG: hypothetical protein A3A05_00230 [Candidatus Nomurabacteria bacterium RIFCSPLOWO2_01_FULL_41_12]